MSSWKTMRLGNVARIYDGTHQTPDYVLKGVPFYSVEHVTSDDFKNTKYISREVFEKENRRVKVEKGDILMTRIGDVGTAKYIDWEAQASFYVSLALIKCNSQVDSKFIAQLINSEVLRREIWGKTLHVAFPNKINLGDIGKCKITIPDLETQQRIVNILETWDRYIDRLNEKIELKKAIKKGLVQNLLTGEKRLNGFTDTWRKMKVKEIFDFIPTYSHSKDQMSYKTGSSASVHNIHYGDIHTKYSNYLDISAQTIPFLIDEGQAIDAKKILKTGDVIVADASEDYVGVGSCVEILNLDGRKCIAGLHTFALRDKSDRLALGYGALLFKNRDVHNWMMRVSTYSKVYGISKTNFSEIVLLLPPVDEQRAIASILSDDDLALQKLVELRRLAQAQKKYLVNHLVTGKIPVPESLATSAKEALYA
jgi:type I restriction enzyme S subunit